MSELNLILLGPPGAGKGTQADRLRDDFGLPHISTGDILRAQVADGTDLGREAKRFMDAGELVPDGVIVGMITTRVGEGDARDGFLLDGFPRNREQADALDAALGNAPAGSIVRGDVHWEAYRDPVSTVVLLDKKTGYHLAQWNL